MSRRANVSLMSGSGGGQMALLLRVARTPGLRKVLLSFAAFAFSEHATWLAVLVYALDRGGPREVGIVAAAQLVPAAIGAPFAAFAGDRFRPQRALAFGYAAQAVSMAATAGAMAADWSMWAYVSASVVATCITFTRPVMRSLLPTITHSPRDLVAANVVAGLIEQVGVFGGPLVAGVIMGLWSPTAVFVVAAVIVCCACLIVLAVEDVDGVAGAPSTVDAKLVIGAVFGGFTALRLHRRLRALVILGASAGLLKGISDVIVVTFADARLEGGSRQAGWLAAAYGIGAIIGAASSTRLVRGARVNRQFLSVALLGGTSLLALTAIGALGPALLAFAMMGTGETILQLTSSVTIQRHAPADLLARVFGILESLSMAAIAVGSLAVTVLVTSTSLTTALVVLSTTLVGFILVSVAQLRRHGADTPMVDEAIVDRLIADPLFAPLPAPTIEHLARTVEPLFVAAGSAAVAEGQIGDRYYLLCEGTVEVTIGGKVRGQLVPGAGFGEIALLRNVPRTATVTALTDIHLLSVPRDAFLEAVTGHPRSHRAANVTIDGHLGDQREKD